MSLIADLLSKVARQTKPLKDVPPGLTNSINTYRKRETNRKKAILFSVVIIASLVSGFAAIYAAKLLFGSAAAPVRAEHAASEPAQPPAPSTAAAPARQTPPERAPEAKQPPAEEKTRPAAAGPPPAAAAQKSPAIKPAGEGSPDALRHYYAALDFEKDGEYTKAIDEYAAALAMEPGSFRLMNRVGSLYMRMGLWEEAARHLDSSVAENGSYVPALINRGIVYAEIGRFEEAETSFKEALRIKPASTLALFNIALLYEKRAMAEKARAHYMKLKQLGDPQGAEGLRRLGGAPASAEAD